MLSDSLYDFSSLRAFLIRKGYKVKTRPPYEVVKSGVVTKENTRDGSMDFRNDGIFTKDSKGYERQVFLYKKDYRLEKYGLPRFHICRCQVIEEFIASGGFKSHYYKTNSVPVTIIDLDDFNEKKKISNLPLCTYCQRLFYKNTNIDLNNATSEEFVEMLKAQDNSEDEVDLFGYVRDWDMISKHIREEKDYTCENCGLQITDLYDRQYIHVHHIDGEKLNNNKSNLKCLCFYCHAHVDNNHKRKLTFGANGVMYRYFYEKYKDKGYWDDSDNDDDEKSVDNLPF